MSYANKRIIVTGLGGLIGSELPTFLHDHGFEIYALTTRKQLPLKNVTVLHCEDLFNTKSIEQHFATVKPAYLLNLAWTASKDYLTANINYKFVKLGIDLLECFKQNGGQKALYAGTAFEYALNKHPLSEHDPLDVNKFAYTFCKHTLHTIAHDFCTRNNIEFSYARIFYVYGKKESEERLTASLIHALMHNKEFRIKNGKLYKDYMYTKDIAAALVAVLQRSVQGPVNICTGHAITIEEFTRTLARKLNKEHLLVFEDQKSNQPSIIVGDNTRLTQEVGYKIQYDLSSALDDMLCDIQTQTD